MTYLNYFTIAALMLLHLAVPKAKDEELSGPSWRIQVQNTAHDKWDALLQKHVTPSGEVSYSDFKTDVKELQEYLSMLSHIAPDENASKEEKLIYYINLYNAATVKLILDHYPIKSIKDIKNPWDKKWIKVGEKIISLGAIEHKILRKLNEPRIHFAINCASFSCPKLLNRAFTFEKLETQLEEASRAFVNDKGKNRISATSADISKIFKWYKTDFTEKGSLVDFINTYSDVSINAGINLKYIEYDWSLNEAK